jgi:uncharacterized membrane protein
MAVSIRLQHLQWAGGAVAAAGSVVLGSTLVLSDFRLATRAATSPGGSGPVSPMTLFAGPRSAEIAVAASIISIRLQHLQWAGGAVAAAGSVVLGSTLVLSDFRSVRQPARAAAVRSRP